MSEPFRQSLDDAGRDALREAAPDIVTDFRGEHNRKLSTQKDRRWGTNGSFSLIVAGPKEGCWYDHELKRGGDILDLIRFELNCSFIEALDYASRFVRALRSYGASARRAPARPAVVKLDDEDDEKRIEEALTIWCDTRPLTGTIAEKYLCSRCIEVPTEALDVLRFHPRCPWEIGTRPAMVALVRDAVTDEPTGVSRTALSAAGAKIGRKVLGLKADGAIKLAAASTELVIAEGIETALSATIMGFGPVWSMIDAGEMSKFLVLPWIERLTIVVDNDANGAGQRAASATRARWEAAGHRVRTMMPVTPGHDANDILVALEASRE